MIKIENNRINRIYQLAEMAFLVLLGLYLMFLAEKTTTFYFEFSIDLEKLLLVAIRIVAIVKIILFLWKEKTYIINDKALLKKTSVLLLSAMVLRIIYYMVYRSDKYEFLLFLGVLVVGSIGSDYKKIMKTYVISVGLFVGATVLASLSGIIVNFVQLRKGKIHSSWGINCTTDYASIVVFLCITAWIAWKELSPKYFFAIGIISVLNSAFIARSTTSTAVGVLFLVAIILDGMSLRKTKKYISVILEVAFPFFTFLTFAIEYLYHRGTAIGIKLNLFFHGRFVYIDNGFKNYGLSLFGTPFSQIGNGGTNIRRSNYNFIDSTYVLILLRYGVILFLAIMVLWVLMTRKAIKLENWRLAFGMGLIALHSFSEHHFPEVNYNVLIVLPFSVLGMGWLVKDEKEKALLNNKRSFVIVSLITVIMVVFIIAVGPQILSLFRTVYDVTEDVNFANKKKIVCVVYMGLLVLLTIAAVSLYKIISRIIENRFEKKKKIEKRIVLPSFVFFAIITVIILGVIAGNRIIDARSASFQKNVDCEKPAIIAIKHGIESSGGQFYVDEMPSLYKEKYEIVTEGFFHGDELADKTNVTILMNADFEPAALINMGFLFAEISADHAIYSNDNKVIKELELAGYHLTGFYSKKRNVDLNIEAERNGLDITPSGAIIIDGRSGSLVYGPYYELHSGDYTVTFELTLRDMDVYDSDYKICTLRASTIWGTGVVNDLPIYRSYFEECNYSAQISFTIPDSQGCEFLVFAESGRTVLLNNITYQKTPSMDVHREYDKRGRVARTSFFDLEGNPIEISDGYHAVEYSYDKEDNVSACWYYDINDKLIVSKYGYAGIEKKYDLRKRVIKDIYYDQDRNRLTMGSGQSAVGYGYDDDNNINEYRYYDTYDNLVTLSKGYAVLRYSFDEKKRIIKEECYDTELKPVLCSTGFFMVKIDYDEADREYCRRYYDTDGKLVVAEEGFAERRRVYNPEGRLLTEEYYGTNGERIELKGGYAIIEYDYDLYGNQTDVRYYNKNESPIMLNEAYFHVCRKFNDRHQVIQESYYDINDNPMLMAEGYVIYEKGYDEYGNVTVNRFLDANGAPVMRNDGFAEFINTYVNNKVVKTEYYDSFGKAVLLPSGYSIVEYTYDENGNMTDSAYYDTDNNPALVNGLYAKVHSVFDDNMRIIREEYMNQMGHLVMMTDGYAVIEREYDARGNAIELRYLDTEDNLSINFRGYAVLCREYDEAKHITREYYLDTYRQPVDCTSGYAVIENSYDPDGNLIGTVYYNAKGEVVE